MAENKDVAPAYIIGNVLYKHFKAIGRDYDARKNAVFGRMSQLRKETGFSNNDFPIIKTLIDLREQDARQSRFAEIDAEHRTQDQQIGLEVFNEAKKRRLDALMEQLEQQVSENPDFALHLANFNERVKNLFAGEAQQAFNSVKGMIAGFEKQLQENRNLLSLMISDNGDAAPNQANFLQLLNAKIGKLSQPQLRAIRTVYGQEREERDGTHLMPDGYLVEDKIVTAEQSVADMNKMESALKGMIKRAGKKGEIEVSGMPHKIFHMYALAAEADLAANEMQANYDELKSLKPLPGTKNIQPAVLADEVEKPSLLERMKNYAAETISQISVKRLVKHPVTWLATAFTIMTGIGLYGSHRQQQNAAAEKIKQKSEVVAPVVKPTNTSTAQQRPSKTKNVTLMTMSVAPSKPLPEQKKPEKPVAAAKEEQKPAQLQNKMAAVQNVDTAKQNQPAVTKPDTVDSLAASKSAASGIKNIGGTVQKALAALFQAMPGLTGHKKDTASVNNAAAVDTSAHTNLLEGVETKNTSETPAIADNHVLSDIKIAAPAVVNNVSLKPDTLVKDTVVRDTTTKKTSGAKDTKQYRDTIGIFKKAGLAAVTPGATPKNTPAVKEPEISASAKLAAAKDSLAKKYQEDMDALEKNKSSWDYKYQKKLLKYHLQLSTMELDGVTYSDQVPVIDKIKATEQERRDNDPHYTGVGQSEKPAYSGPSAESDDVSAAVDLPIMETAAENAEEVTTPPARRRVMGYTSTRASRGRRAILHVYS